MQNRLRVTPALLLLSACSGTGQPEVSYPAYAVVAPPSVLTVGAWTVTISEAAFAFGPAYFCASVSGGCETANSELVAITRIDALDPTPQPLGRVRGFEGDIRSASLDYGIHWFLTESEAHADPAAPGGHSARFAGMAESGDRSARFVAEVDVQPSAQGLRAVSSVEARAAIQGAQARLEIRFDVRAWLENGLEKLDFDSACEPCVIDADSAPSAHTAIVLAMQQNHPPMFDWSGADVGPLP